MMSIELSSMQYIIFLWKYDVRKKFSMTFLRLWLKMLLTNPVVQCFDLAIFGLKNSDYCRSPTWVLAKVGVSSLNQQTFPFYKSVTLSKPRKVRLAMKCKLMFSKYYCYYVGVAHWIDLRLVVKFLEVLCQQGSSNLNNISENPCRTRNGSFLQFHYSCLNPYVIQLLL